MSLSSWKAANVVGAKILQKMREALCWEGVWFLLDPSDFVGLRTTASVRSVPKKYGPQATRVHRTRVKEELQQYGEGCGGRHAQVS